MERSTLRFSHRGREYEALLVRRPFREGAEVTLEAFGRKIHLAELGLGEQAIIERLKSELDRLAERGGEK